MGSVYFDAGDKKGAKTGAGAAPLETLKRPDAATANRGRAKSHQYWEQATIYYL